MVFFESWTLLTLSTLVTLVGSQSPLEGETLRCVCTTLNCMEIGEPICTTPGLCYTQFLDRRDGSDPVTKGCVNRKTPLLCENRRPKNLPLKILWPILFCCHTDMCNQVDLPFNLQTMVNSSELEVMNATDAEGAADRSSNSQNKRNTLSNPSVVAIFSSGLVVLLAIGITGCCVLQRGQMY